jgi:flagellar basal body-associated protein FliL
VESPEAKKSGPRRWPLILVAVVLAAVVALIILMFVASNTLTPG